MVKKSCGSCRFYQQLNSEFRGGLCELLDGRTFADNKYNCKKWKGIKYNRNKEKIYQRSLDLIDEMFDNISDEEFLEDYLAGEQYKGPLAKDFITKSFFNSFFVGRGFTPEESDEYKKFIEEHFKDGK